MANYERDKEDVRVFDGGEDDDDGEGSHLPVVIIIAILVLAAFGGVVWLAYNQGVARGRGDAQPRIAMGEAGKGDNSGLKVYQQPAAGEEDDNAALKHAATPPAIPAQATPQQAADPAPAPAAVPASQPTPAPAKTETPAPLKAVQQPVPAPVKVTQAAPPKVAPTPAQTAPAQASAPAVATKPPAQLGLAHPAPVSTTPASTTPPKTATTAPAKPVTSPAATSAPVKTAATKPAPSGSYFLQIGAYRSETEAMTAWKTYQSKHAALLSGFGPDVQKADLGDKGVWYRLRIATAADKDAAVALCDRLKAQNGACFLAH